MPPAHYATKLSNADIIELFATGAYRVNPTTGQVYGRFGKQLFSYTGDRSRNRWVRLYHKPKYRSIPIAHLVWMYVTRYPIPDGFEIHHHNKNVDDDTWPNLFCLYTLDHAKLHNGNGEHSLDPAQGYD